MRSRGPSAFTVGAVLLVVAVIVIYLGFTKDIPLLNEPYVAIAPAAIARVPDQFGSTACSTRHWPWHTSLVSKCRRWNCWWHCANCAPALPGFITKGE